MRQRSAASNRWSGIKIIALAVIFSLGFAGVWVRAYYVQIRKGQSLVERAKRQYWASRQLQGERGAIFDCKGRLLAKSVPTHSVFINPTQIKDVRKTVATLHKIVGGSKKRLASRVRSKGSFVWVARKIGDRQAARIRQAKMPGVYLKEEWMRMYPQGHVAAQLLGFVGIDGKGLEGLERSFDKELRGTSVRQRVQRDAVGSQLYMGKDVQNVDGSSITLTLDSVIQSAAEEALGQSVETFHGKSGTCLVVEVGTGNILAWAHYPFFDPNQYRKANSRLWKNRMCLDLVEPGSTLKPFVVAAALQNKMCSSSSRFFCENGEWKMGTNRIRDTHKYKNLRVDEILRYSSNIGMAKMGIALGAGKLYHQLKAFGFTEPTGIRVPGEARGIIRPPGKWSTFDLAAASFGQGVAVTPLQLARAYMVFGNKGRMRALHIVQGEANKGHGRQVISSKVARTILEMLRDAVEKDGTGTRARIPGIHVGGKTGTAQKPGPSGGYGEDFLASFVGFIPALEPKYLIVVMVDEPKPQHYGGVVSAPVFKKVGMKLLAYRGESSSGDGARQVKAVLPGTPRVQSRIRQGGVHVTSQTTLPDLCGMPLRRAVEIMARHGVIPALSGQGMFVTRQQPEAGTAWKQIKAGAKPKLWLTTERSSMLCP